MSRIRSIVRRIMGASTLNGLTDLANYTPSAPFIPADPAARGIVTKLYSYISTGSVRTYFARLSDHPAATTATVTAQADRTGMIRITVARGDGQSFTTVLDAIGAKAAGRCLCAASTFAASRCGDRLDETAFRHENAPLHDRAQRAMQETGLFAGY